MHVFESIRFLLKKNAQILNVFKFYYFNNFRNSIQSKNVDTFLNMNVLLNLSWMKLKCFQK